MSSFWYSIYIYQKCSNKCKLSKMFSFASIILPLSKLFNYSLTQLVGKTFIHLFYIIKCFFVFYINQINPIYYKNQKVKLIFDLSYFVIINDYFQLLRVKTLSNKCYCFRFNRFIYLGKVGLLFLCYYLGLIFLLFVYF